MKIILIEDNYDHAEMFRRYVRRLSPDIDIAHFEEGMEAFQYVMAAPEEIRLLVVDLRLRMQNGVDLINNFREKTETRSIPIVVLTSSTQERNSELSAKVDDYLIKPVNERMLKGLLDRFTPVLQRRRNL